MRSLKRVAAVIGVGHSDWVGDWNRVRAGERPNDSYGYAADAFRNALADAGIDRSRIDGLIVGPTTAYERMAEVLGLNVRWGDQADAVLSVFQACMAIETGMADVVALTYGNDQRSVGTQYGGPQAMGGVLEMMGFRPIARHRSREVELYRQGTMNVIVNAQPTPFDEVADAVFSQPISELLPAILGSGARSLQ